MLGKTIGPYQVEDAIGRGGMGEVFRARDTKLGRDVALKILPTELAREPERLTRFQREARVLASLQHQNIAAIFGLEEADGLPVLVMELAEGQDLSERMRSGPLPLAEVDKIARQLARGLEYAHEQGIVHRDLKPANVKVAGDGRVKILDFGLARAFQAEGVAEPDSVELPAATITQALTGAGTVLGTAAYMSPEQARGYEVDRRSDIWAYGVILHEMLTGERLFEGETATDTLAAVLRHDPDWDRLPAETPPMLAHIARRCLEKDPQQRLRDIGEARVALEGSSTSVAGWTQQLSNLDEAPGAVRASGRRAPWILSGVLAAAVVALGWLGINGTLGPAPAPAPLVQSQIAMPFGHQLNLNPAAPAPAAISPDGRRVVFGAQDSTGTVQLFVRELAEREARPIPGTDQSAYPFWAPDSRTVAFFNLSNLVKVDIGGGPVVTICPAENGKGGSWHENGMILLAPTHTSAIQLVASDGGTPVPVTDLSQGGGSRSHRFPQWFPDGEHFFFTAVRRQPEAGNYDSTIRVGRTADDFDRELMPTQTCGVLAEGALLYVQDEILMARPIDPVRFDFTAPAKPLFDDVLAINAAHLSAVSAAGDVLLYSSGSSALANMRIHLIAADGRDLGPASEPLLSLDTQVSPDGQQVVLSMPDPQRGTMDLWLYDRERRLTTRFTLGVESEMSAHWTPDGRWVVYSSDVSGTQDLYRKRANGAGEPELLLAAPGDLYVTDISRDGRTLCVTHADSAGAFAVKPLDLAGPGQSPEFRDFSYTGGAGSFSPNGRWLVYVSFETGAREIYAESLPPGGGRWRVSPEGGMHPRWSRDGRRIFYLTERGELAAVPVVESDGALKLGAVEVLTAGVPVPLLLPYSEDPTNGDLLVMKPLRTSGNSRLNLITGWQRLLADSPQG